MQQGQFEKAQVQFEKVISTWRDETIAYIGIGRIALEQENWSKAGDWFDKALEIDPEDIAAHYYRGITHREQAKFRTIFQRRHWNGAEKHFEWVLSRDSLYKDVLYQYSLLRSYHEANRKAIQLGHAQIRLRPQLLEPRLGLFKLYRRYIHLTPKDSALQWLKQQPSDIAAYFSGEKLRLEGNLTAADSIFVSLLTQTLTIPGQPVLLSRVRVKYEMDDPKGGQELFEQAIREISNREEAEHIFRDVKYILTKDEVEYFRQANTVQEYQYLFETIWNRRDPMPASEVNVRMREHYHRLIKAEREYAFEGFRLWINNPDVQQELDFPDTYTLNDEFNDKGLVFIRHGEPDDRVFSVGQHTAENESWRYYDPAMILHFAIDEDAVGNNWRLVPTLRAPEMWESRVIWGGLYARLLRADSEVERQQILEAISQESRDAVTRALTTDEHSWPNDLITFDFPFLIASFREKDNRTRVEVYYELPEETFDGDKNVERSNLLVEFGFTVFDTYFRESGTATNTLPLSTAEPDGDDSDFFVLSLNPGKHNISLQARIMELNALGGYRFTYNVPQFSLAKLGMSDILPAENIRVTGKGESREQLIIDGKPSRKFSIERPVFVYYEIYGLKSGFEGLSHFTLDYTLIPHKGRRRVLGLFGPVVYKPGVSLSTRRSSTVESPIDYTEIDVTGVPPGTYTLRVKVIDETAGTSVERSIDIELID